MWAKLIKEEEGEYIDMFSGKAVNLLIAENYVHTPEGQNSGWFEFNNEEEAYKFFGVVKAGEAIEMTTDIPNNVLVVYELQNDSYNKGKRIVYWSGNISATENYFRIDFLVKHENFPELDKWTYTYVDRHTTIQNPETGEDVNEYEFFYYMAQNMPILDVIQFGIQKADLDGTINRRLYE